MGAGTASSRLTLWTASGALLLQACSAEPVRPPSAEAQTCARLVAVYRGLEAPVIVTEAEANPEKRKVRIDYEATDARNLSIDGVALCRFRSDGQREVTNAMVDGNRLTEAEIAAFNAR